MEKFKPNRKRKTISNNPTIDLFIKVQILAFAIYFAVFMLFCFGALGADLSAEYDLICSLFSFALSSFIVGFYTGSKLKQNGLLSGIIYSAPINTLIVLISLIYSEFKVDINIIITVIALVLASAVGGVVAVNKRRKR